MKFLPKEVWRDIPGFDGLYEMSTLGRVRNRVSGDYMKISVPVGYKVCYLLGDTYRIHILMAKCFPLNEPYYDGCAVHHINHNKLDNRPQNLMVMDFGEHTRLHSKGKKLSESHKEKLRESTIGQTPWNKGKKMSEEYCEKNRQAHIALGLWKDEKNPFYNSNRFGVINPNHKAVIQYTKDGEFVREWDYAKLASDELGINPGSISSCCKGKLKTAGGYIWKYKNEA